MSKLIKFFLITLLAGLVYLLFFSEYKGSAKEKLVFGTSGTYPPFEFTQNGVLTGFDVELAKLVADELGKEAEFIDMDFGVILTALNSGSIDAGIAAVTATDARKKNFDFSQEYYYETIAAVYSPGIKIKSKADLKGKTILCQLGTTMYDFAKTIPGAKVSAVDSIAQIMESLKSGLIDVVLIDGAQAKVWQRKNPEVSYTIVDSSEFGYGIVVKKGNEQLLADLNNALYNIKTLGKLEKLEQKWFEV